MLYHIIHKEDDNMNKNEIELKALNSFGIAKAYVDENTVTIKVYGVSGCLKAWLTGEKTLELGNIVNGTLTKEVNTAPYDGILLTQSGRQMFYGKLCKSPDLKPLCFEIQQKKDPIFSFNDGYSWKEIKTKQYPSENLSVRYILSHKCFYNAFLQHGKYFYGTKENKCAIAIECDIKHEPHPFLHLSGYSIFKDGYMIVCVDTKSKTFCQYE